MQRARAFQKIVPVPVFTSIVQRISRSRIFEDYEKAFVAATGLPLRFQPATGERRDTALPLRNHPSENPFCALMSENEEGCRICKEVEQRLQDTDSPQERTEVCLAGLADTAVPIHLHGRIAGFLRTGQVALSKPAPGEFSRIARTLVDWGFKTDLSKLEEAWAHSKVLSPAQYEAFIQLLKVFARHLSLAAEHLSPDTDPGESPVIQKARAYIQAHQQEDVRVEDVAKVLNMSVFYFCKVFRKTTGMTFTGYLAQVRVAKARQLLLNPHLRISEIAFASGFQSLTHFNRVFRKMTGKSPSAFRSTQAAAESDAHSV